jgi:hypothetical protein
MKVAKICIDWVPSLIPYHTYDQSLLGLRLASAAYIWGSVRRCSLESNDGS